jgi:hypothetical protein
MANKVNSQIADDRYVAQQRGNELTQDQRDRAGYSGTRRQYYSDEADRAYDPLLYGQGGYTQAEQAAIMREGELKGAMTTPEQEAQNYLTPDEATAMRGDPNAAVGGLETGLQGAVGGMQEAVGTTEARVGAAVDPSRLRADNAALDQIRMSPEEEQRIVTSAGTSAGLARQAQIDTLQRQSRAAGMNVLGVAAAGDRYQRSADAEAVDAQTRARIGARDSRAGAAATAENIRQSGEGAAANAGLAAETYMGGLRLKPAEAAYNAAETTGQARIQAEQAGAGREATIATNRQGVSEGNQAQRYQQGYQTNTALSGRAAGVGDARMKEGAEARGYYTGQEGQWNSNQQAEYDRQGQTYGQQMGGMSNTTGQLAAWEQRKKPWEKVVGAATGALKAAAPLFADGGVVTEPTLAIVGEAGPEAIVPLRYRETAKVRPQVAQRYMRAA